MPSERDIVSSVPFQLGVRLKSFSLVASHAELSLFAQRKMKLSLGSDVLSDFHWISLVGPVAPDKSDTNVNPPSSPCSS